MDRLIDGGNNRIMESEEGGDSLLCTWRGMTRGATEHSNREPFNRLHDHPGV